MHVWVDPSRITSLTLPARCCAGAGGEGGWRQSSCPSLLLSIDGTHTDRRTPYRYIDAHRKMWTASVMHGSEDSNFRAEVDDLE